MSETQLVKSILDALAFRFKGRLKVWRNNTGAMRTEGGGFIKFGALGSPDILGVLSPGGRLVAFEVKAPKGKTTPHQEAWLSEAKQLGALVGVVRSIDEAFAVLSGENLTFEAPQNLRKPQIREARQTDET